MKHAIQPIHHSMYPKGLRTPRNMDILEEVSQEQRDAIQDIAMSIFVDCVNVGVPFQDAIMSVYISGLQHGSSLRKDNK